MRISLLALLLFTLLTACAGAGYQKAPRPAEGAPVPGDRCRVYVARADGTTGSIRQVRVLDSEVEVGAIAEDEYLCWDRLPERGIGTLVYEGFAPALRGVENVFDLPREAGSTTWFVITIPHSGRQPQVEALSPEDGRALIARRKPAR